jgi:SAM-dependent methyltransferase
MKIRESGMPTEEVWTQFFDPPTIFEKLGLTSKIQAVADFGAGYGTFTKEIAKYADIVYALDIEMEMISKLAEQCAILPNIRPQCIDFMNDSGLEDNSLDLVLLFNILHTENMDRLFQEVSRVLKRNGKVAVIHWNYDSTTPRGPPMEIRKMPEEISEFFHAKGMETFKTVNLPPYHFGFVFTWA